MSHFSIVLSTLLAFQAGALAQGASKALATDASLVCEVGSIAPSTTFTTALTLHHPEGWHSYYLNSGGLEQAPTIKWSLPNGFSAGPIQWPTPSVKDGFFGKSFVYHGSPVFLVDITAPSSLAPGTSVTLSADASWQICAESCINEKQTLTLTLPVSPTPAANPATRGLFASARASQAAKPGKWKISAQAASNDILLRVDPGSTSIAQPTDFIPDQAFVQAASAGGAIQRDDQGWTIRLPRATQDALGHAIAQGSSLSGILLGQSPFAIPETAITSASPQSLPVAGFLNILGGMLLGGLILNLMPCVFPVIGLKIMSFVQQAGEDRRKIVWHGVAFTLGVLASFAVLSGILFTARTVAGVDAVGWGYQLQNPWVVLALMLLMFVLALNLFGVFEMGTSATSLGGSLHSKQGLAGSFFSGALATVVATPCSGPLLGVALGAAITLPALQFFLAFTAMAVGLALPYLILSVFPKLLHLLPRPGAWMESFKQAMSFLLFATTGYLLWVYAGQIGADHLLGPVFGLCAIAVAAWIHGRWSTPLHGRRTRMVALVFTVAFAAGGGYLAKPPPPSTPITWETWSETKVAELLDRGTPVYIDFTALWCPTCQVNKYRAYTPEVVALMKAKGVVALKADKTNPDPQIEAALRRLGRTAIPVNVLLAPKMDPIILPEFLSPNDVLDALRKIQTPTP